MDSTNTIVVATAMLRAALICASTEQIRYYLNGIFFDPAGFIVAIDGHRMFVAQLPEASARPEAGFIVPLAALKRILTGNKQVDIEVSTTMIDGMPYTPVDGTFPDWRRVVSQTATGENAQFNLDYLGDFAKMAKLLTGHKTPSVHVYHNGASAACILFGERRDCFAIIMPTRTDSPAEWAIPFDVGLPAALPDDSSEPEPAEFDPVGSDYVGDEVPPELADEPEMIAA